MLDRSRALDGNRDKEIGMNRDWIKPGVWGFVGGSVVTMVLGFGWGGWTTRGST